MYVDDVIIGGGNEQQRLSEVDLIFERFEGKLIHPEIKNNIKCYDINGIELEVDEKNRSFVMHMEKYINKTLDKFNMSNATTTIHPKVNPDLILRDQIDCDFPVQECLGCLIWLSTTCRPDITYDVSVLARFVGIYKNSRGCANACKKILKYLKGSKRKGINYSPRREKEFQMRYDELIKNQCKSAEFGTVSREAEQFSKNIFIFSDASFASCPLTLKSQTGSCIYFRGVLIAYKTSRQTVISHSTCASEFIACSDTLTFCEKLEDQLNLFENCKPSVFQSKRKLLPVFVDNQSAIRISRADVLNNSSKHLKLRYLKVTEQQKRLFFVPTKAQEADAFTKSLGEAIFAMFAVE